MAEIHSIEPVKTPFPSFTSLSQVLISSKPITNSLSTSPLSDALLTPVATPPRKNIIPLPNIIITSIHNSPSLIAYKLPPSTSETKTSFTVTSASEPFTNLLNNAPTFSFADRLHWTDNGNHKITRGTGKRFKAGIYLDDLPKSIPRPKFAPVAPAVASSSIIAGAGEGRRKRRALVAGAESMEEMTTKKKRTTTTTTAVSSTATMTTNTQPVKEVSTAIKSEAQKPATAAPRQRKTMSPAPSPPAIKSTVATATATARPKGLEIDMVPATFAATGERTARPRKRPARFGLDEVEVKLEMERKKSKIT
ncbi:MAG: hypothetical protein Q9186_003291 [Xanthomendoza sp. 1 TL-2023]